MKISRAGEFAAIERIRGICRRPGREVVVGIGDDAAAFRAAKGALTLATSDMLIEGVHFDLSYTGFLDLGFKALAANLSDIAAMGGRPLYYLVSLALRKDMKVEDLEYLYKGMESLAAAYGVTAIGGDTCATSGPMVVSIAVLGEATPKKLVRRSGARAGDGIYVSGTLGDSAAGLGLLKSGAGAGAGKPKPDVEYLVSRHMRPNPRVKAGRSLAENGLATSMIDISDGLSSDLGHILDESGVGAEIHAELIPMSGALLSAFGKKKAMKLALHGGEDYELLFTARRQNRGKVTGLAGRQGTAITLVGTVTEGKGAVLVSAGGKKTALRPKGYEHFSR